MYVKKLVQQTQRYEFADGLRDLQLASMMATMGFATWVIFDKMDVWMPFTIELAGRVGGWGRWSMMLVVLLPSLLGLGVLLVMRLVRRRWLWRNTGIVKPSRQIVPLRVTLISVVIVLAALGLGALMQTFRTNDDLFLLRLLFIASGWSFGYTLVEMGQRLDLQRYVRVGLGISAVTAILLFLPLTVGQTALWWGLAWGAALALSGIGPLREAAHKASEGGHE